MTVVEQIRLEPASIDAQGVPVGPWTWRLDEEKHPGFKTRQAAWDAAEAAYPGHPIG